MPTVTLLSILGVESSVVRGREVKVLQNANRPLSLAVF